VVIKSEKNMIVEQGSSREKNNSVFETTLLLLLSMRNNYGERVHITRILLLVTVTRPCVMTFHRWSTTKFVE